jgi:integrase/recombinase XerD
MAYKYKRKGSPFWYVGYYDPATGKKAKPFSTKTNNAKIADTKVKEIEETVEKNKIERVKLRNSDILLSKAFEIFVIDRRNTKYKYRERTVNTYQNALKYVYKSCGDKAISKYNRNDYYLFSSSMEKLAHNSKSLYAEKIYTLFKFFVSEKFIYDNPFKRIAEVKKIFELLTETEIKLIREYASKTKFLDVIDFMILSAFRINEVLNLKASDITDSKIIINEAKGNKTRSIPITNEMKKYLKYYMNKKNIKKGEDVLLFNFTVDNIFRFWARCRKAKHLRHDITSHSLRKYTLSNMANNGVSINFVMAYAGHESIKTTMKYYIKNDPEKMINEIDGKIKFIK